MLADRVSNFMPSPLLARLYSSNHGDERLECRVGRKKRARKPSPVYPPSIGASGATADARHLAGDPHHGGRRGASPGGREQVTGNENRCLARGLLRSA